MIKTLAWLTIATLCAGCGTTTLTSPTSTQDTAKLREFAGELVPGGSASRQFEVSASGAIVVTLQSTSPPGVMIGVGVGIPRSNGTCALSSAIETVAGATAQLTIAAASGDYCTRAYDPGSLTAPLAFAILISHP